VELILVVNAVLMVEVGLANVLVLVVQVNILLELHFDL
jgi:hypothetical protein